MVDTSHDDVDDDADYVTDDDNCENQEIEEIDQDDHGENDGKVDIADHVGRANAMLSRNHMALTVKSSSTDRWISKAKRVDCGVGLADGGADTIVCGSGWLQQSTTLRTANIQGFPDDLQKQKIPIGTSLAATTTNTGETIILQANEALQIPENQYSILSTLQLREHGIQVNDVAECHAGRLQRVRKPTLHFWGIPPTKKARPTRSRSDFQY